MLFGNKQTIVCTFKKFIARIAILLGFIILLISACTSRMTIEEAKNVAISMSPKSFVPPPRSIDDILTQLSQYHEPRSEVANELKAKLEEPLPKNKTPESVAIYYYNRGKAAMYLGRSGQALQDLRLALDYSNKTTSQNDQLLQRVGIAELSFGNYKRAIELFEQTLNWKGSLVSYDLLVKIHARLGDLETAQNYMFKGIARCNELRQHHNSGPWPDISANRIRAYVLEAQGRFEEAEIYQNRILKNNTSAYKQFKRKHPTVTLAANQSLIGYLKNQNRLAEAELVARQNLLEMLNLSGSDSAFSGHCISDLADILFRQGRLNDAEKLLKIAVRTLEKAGVSAESYMMVETMIRLGEVLAAKGEFDRAAVHFDLVQSGMKENRFLYEKYFKRNFAIMNTLLQTGRVDEAVQQIETVYAKNSSTYGVDHYLTKEVQGLRGMALALKNKNQEAYADFSMAMPILLEKSSAEILDYAKHIQLKIIIESYMKLLAKWTEEGRGQDFEINPSAELFRLADAISSKSVRSAIVASSARVTASEPNLSDLIRKGQDASQQIKMLQAALAENMSTPRDQRLSGIVADLQQKLFILTAARNLLQTEIVARFPKYADFTAPDPATISEVQSYLRMSEALVFIYPAEDSTYVWAVPQNGAHVFARMELGRQKLQNMIEKLRRALDPNASTFGNIPEFDLVLAHSLYTQLLQPVADGWQEAKHLLIVAPGPLGQLPFAVLPTAPTPGLKNEGLLFDQYKAVPWLIRKVSITRLPSTATLAVLRKLPATTPRVRPLVGFGDAIFNPAQLESGNQTQTSEPQSFESGRAGLNFRGIRITESGLLDDPKITSIHLESLQRLPDTAEELENIAQTLNADQRHDLFLREKASEEQVKTIDLSNRQVVAFATHALVPGDLDGLDQPAIALSSPAVTGGIEDGLLTMGEIMTLRLNSDWVVLSACNTGASDGKGAEAVSGLGRAFFYAGSRALLVSMWPVETTSAGKLTTGLFRYQKENPASSRAQALRQSMLQLIDSPGLMDNASGKIVASYAHPIFWAPFIVIGDSGLR
jgi:CHAT domain-containing protein/predicted negative regulator of RcsB-dependent stress response